jgi:hypothetical protein
MQRSLPLLAAAFASISISAAARAEDTAAPVISYTAPSTAPKAPFTVTAKITDESKFFPQVFFRRGAGPYDKPLDMKKKAGAKDMYEATIPYKGDKLEFYIEAYDEFGNGPARSGDPDAPIKVSLADATPPPPVASATPNTTTTTTTTTSTTTTTTTPH